LSSGGLQVGDGPAERVDHGVGGLFSHGCPRMSGSGRGIEESPVSAAALGRILDLMADGTINGRIAKTKAQDRLRDAEMIRERIKQLFRTEKQRQGPPFEDLRRKILELIGPKPELAALYRNFEEVTEADMESMIEDLDLIDNIEKNGGF